MSLIFSRKSFSLLRSSALSPKLSRCMSKLQEPADEATEEDRKQGWLSRMLVRRIDPGRESHSSQLSDKDTVFELQMHKVQPQFMEEYLNEYERFVNTVQEKDTGAQLEGSWTVEIGDQDEAVHLWKYPGGYPVLNRATQIYRTDKEFIDFRVNRNKMLRARKNQILLAFSFWGDIQPRDGKNIYELRSYTLKPGTMIEWGNNWARGIKFRQEKNEAVAGFFNQIGDLYTAYHLWAYESLQDRKKIREAAWLRPGWDEVVAHTAYDSLQSRKEVRDDAWRRPGWDVTVANTVPLIRHMTARVLIPTPFSPLQ